MITLHTKQRKGPIKRDRQIDIERPVNELTHFYNNRMHERRNYGDIEVWIDGQKTGITANSLKEACRFKAGYEMLLQDAKEGKCCRELLDKVLLHAKARTMKEFSALIYSLYFASDVEEVCNNWIRNSLEHYPKENLSHHSQLFIKNNDYTIIAEMLDMELGSSFENFVWACREYYEWKDSMTRAHETVEKTQRLTY